MRSPDDNPKAGCLHGSMRSPSMGSSVFQSRHRQQRRDTVAVNGRSRSGSGNVADSETADGLAEALRFRSVLSYESLHGHACAWRRHGGRPGSWRSESDVFSVACPGFSTFYYQAA